MYKTRAELKKLSKEQLKGKWGASALLMLVYFLFVFAISIMLNYFAKEYGFNAFIILGYALFILFTLGLILGVLSYFIKVVKSDSPRVYELFTKFSLCPKAVLVYLILLVITLIPVLIGGGLIAACVFLNSTYPIAAISFGIAFGILTLIFLFYISFGLALSFIILVDEPKNSAFSVIKKSWGYMKGNKWRLFVLYLSFLGWILLGGLTIYIGFLWIGPYMYTTITNFYFELKGEVTGEDVPTDTGTYNDENTTPEMIEDEKDNVENEEPLKEEVQEEPQVIEQDEALERKEETEDNQGDNNE